MTPTDPPTRGTSKNIDISDVMENKKDNQAPNLVSAVNNLQFRQSAWQQNGIRKERSPMVPVHINKRFTLATVDEGSEINCMDESFAIQNKIAFVPTICTATAANQTTMKLAGQTEENVHMTIQGTREPVSWNLGNMVVVQNLGANILIGEPGK